MKGSDCRLIRSSRNTAPSFFEFHIPSYFYSSHSLPIICKHKRKSFIKYHVRCLLVVFENSPHARNQGEERIKRTLRRGSSVSALTVALAVVAVTTAVSSAVATAPAAAAAAAAAAAKAIVGQICR